MWRTATPSTIPLYTWTLETEKEGKTLNEWLKTITTFLVTLLGSAGFWSWLDARRARKEKANAKNDVNTRLLVGIAHDRITFLGMRYVERGYITRDEYENLNDYIYVPYAEAGGNGSAKRVMEEVRKLPLRN